MKGKKHNAEQIIKKLREADAMLAADKSIGQACQALEISEQTFHRWRNQYGGMKAEEAKRLKELDDGRKKRCQEPFSCFRGRPCGRSVDSKPNCRTARSLQRSSPKGLPRCTLRRKVCSSPSVWGALT